MIHIKDSIPKMRIHFIGNIAKVSGNQYVGAFGICFAKWGSVKYM